MISKQAALGKGRRSKDWLSCPLGDVILNYQELKPTKSLVKIM